MMDIFKDFFNKEIIIAFLLGGGLSLLLGPIIIPMLRRLKFRQNIRQDGPQSHLKKAGTPTIGGLIFIISIILVMLIMRYDISDEGMVVLYGTVAFGSIGFIDDILKIIRKKNEGLTSKQKFVSQIIFSAVFAYCGYKTVGTSISIPFSFKILTNL